MVIHTFGAYYGLTISWVLYRPKLDQSKSLNGSVYHSDVFAMIGKWLLIHYIYARDKIVHELLSNNVSSYRDPLPLDVLAQLQLCHRRSWRRTTSGRHKHLPCSGCFSPYYVCHIKPFSQEGKSGHGKLHHLIMSQLHLLQGFYS